MQANRQSLIALRHADRLHGTLVHTKKAPSHRWPDTCDICSPALLQLGLIHHRHCKDHKPYHRNSRGSLRSTTAAAAAAGDGSFAAAQPAASDRSRSGLSLLLQCLPGRPSVQLVRDAWLLLRSNLLAVLVIYLAKDAAAFLLHRVVHRLTNHLAEAAFNIPISTLANPWWIVADAQFMEGHVGYQVLVGVFFLLCLPINILCNTAAASTAIAVCVNRQAALSGPGVATASFTGQGRGKVGLADYPRPPSTHTSYDEGDLASSSSSSSLSFSEAAEAAAARLSAEVGSSQASSRAASSSSSSSSGRRRGSSESSPTTAAAAAASAAAAAATAAVGVATFVRGMAAVSFRAGARLLHPASSAGPSGNSSSSSSGAKSPLPQPPQPPPAPALPWLTVVQERSQPPPMLGLKPSLAAVQEAWQQQVAGRLRQLWHVDLLFNLWALPLQAASLAVIPAFWTFPRLLGIQLAMPAAVLGGAQGSAALQASQQLMAGFKAAYAWPFVWMIVAARMLEVVRDTALLAMPNRWWTDVPEVPLAATALFFAVRLVLMRLQDMMPLVAYLTLVRQQQQQQQQLQGRPL